jgi:hypothetical protein
VQVVSNRYPETVEVDLYTFTGACPPNTASGTRCGDSTIGTVTFEAVANIVVARDALPANNTAISLPVTVN